MPTYVYYCEKCKKSFEITHSIKDESIYKCKKCSTEMLKSICWDGHMIASGLKPTRQDHRESEHTKKVKDFDRAVKMRKKAFGKDSVGDPEDRPDPRHIIKRGKTLAGQQKEIDKTEFIKSAAKDDYMVAQSLKALKKQKK